MLKWKTFFRRLCVECNSHSRIINFSTAQQISSAVQKPKENHTFSDNEDDTETPTQINGKRISHKARLDLYFKSSKRRLNLRPLIPDKCLRQKRTLDQLYLIDPYTAKKVAQLILPYIKKNPNQVIAECTPGLGLISKELLKNELSLRLYEPTSEFSNQLEKLSNIYAGRVQLFTKDLFRIPLYFYLDKVDNGNRIEQLLRDVPKKSWDDDPVMTIIGPTTNTYFLRHLARALPMQTTLATYGRVEMFLIMKPRDYLILSADVPLNLTNYRYMTIIFNLFFDYELIEKLPREAFLPWEEDVKYILKPKLRQIDEDKMYLVHIIWKKDLPVKVDQLVPFYFFVKQFFRGKTQIIPTLETWVPGCGENIICPKLHHEDYYKDMSIHTQFGELTPSQIVGVFKEMYEHPSYKSSPFSGMVEAELIKSETVETNKNIVTLALEKSITQDIEVNLDNN